MYSYQKLPKIFYERKTKYTAVYIVPYILYYLLCKKAREIRTDICIKKVIKMVSIGAHIMGRNRYVVAGGPLYQN